MRRIISRRLAAAGIGLTLALGSLPGPGATQPAGAQGAEQATLVVGDSLFRVAPPESATWRVNWRNGRPMAGASGLVADLIERHQPTVVVVALGTNDVRLGRSALAMERTLASVLAITEGRCTVLTTVTPFGSAFYNRLWRRVALRFNRIVLASGHPVADWAQAVRDDRSLLLGDGVHLTTTGRAAYVGILRSAAEACR